MIAKGKNWKPGYPATRVETKDISNGASGTLETLKMMADLVRSDQGRQSPHIRVLSVRIVNSCRQKDKLCEIIKIHRFVRDRIRYINDIHGVETLHSPLKILEYGSGDCDDKTMLVSAMLESIGFSTRIVAVGYSSNRFCHVIAEVFFKGKWVPLETTEPVKVGWYPSKMKHRLVVKI